VIVLTCRCGNRFDVHDKLAGKRYRCPACSEPMDVPLAPLKPGPPPLPKPTARGDAVQSSPPPVRPRTTKTPPRAAGNRAASPVQRYVWVWLGIAAIVPVAFVSIVFALYLLLTRTPPPAVAEKENEPQQYSPPRRR